MELSVMLDHSADPRRAADEAAALEAAGLDAVWVAEAWGFDPPTRMPNVTPVGPEPARLIETVKSWL
ncbi:hypothetical protein GCM10010286_00090 [Streptomyces toxytricini]|nr:hypothetical protein GCM10010286_00090 [Streptomyces toxytricini]